MKKKVFWQNSHYRFIWWTGYVHYLLTIYHCFWCFNTIKHCNKRVVVHILQYTLPASGVHSTIHPPEARQKKSWFRVAISVPGTPERFCKWVSCGWWTQKFIKKRSWSKWNCTLNWCPENHLSKWVCFNSCLFILISCYPSTFSKSANIQAS